MWDPAGEKITGNAFDIQKRVLLGKAANYKNDPSLIIKYLTILIILPIAVFLWRVHYLGDRLSWDLIILSTIPVIFFYQSIIHLQGDLILFLLCQDNHWEFNPDEDPDRLQKVSFVYPNIFLKGRDQKVADQIWGNLQNNNKTTDFWRCTFQYTVGSGKSSQTFKRAVFILKLNKKIPVSFSLEKAGFLSQFGEDIRTESEEFNKRFKIVRDDKDEMVKTQIIGILSPSVQVRLINFADMVSIETIRFQNDVMIIVFEKEIWKSVFTNFFKKVVIDEKDKSLFFESLKNMAELPSEMIQFID